MTAVLFMPQPREEVENEKSTLFEEPKVGDVVEYFTELNQPEVIYTGVVKNFSKRYFAIFYIAPIAGKEMLHANGKLSVTTIRFIKKIMNKTSH